MSELTLYCARDSRDELFVKPDHKEILFQACEKGVWIQVCLSHKDARTLAEYLLLQLPSEQTNAH